MWLHYASQAARTPRCAPAGRWPHLADDGGIAEAVEVVVLDLRVCARGEVRSCACRAAAQAGSERRTHTNTNTRTHTAHVEALPHGLTDRLGTPTHAQHTHTHVHRHTWTWKHWPIASQMGFATHTDTRTQMHTQKHTHTYTHTHTDLEVLAHRLADLLRERQRAVGDRAAHEQAARDGQVERVVRRFERHDAQVGLKRVPRQVDGADGRRRDIQQLPVRRLVRRLWGVRARGRTWLKRAARWCVCVCVCACVRACVRTCVCVCVRVHMRDDQHT